MRVEKKSLWFRVMEKSELQRTIILPINGVLYVLLPLFIARHVMCWGEWQVQSDVECMRR
jgi:hypothetical protein